MYLEIMKVRATSTILLLGNSVASFCYFEIIWGDSNKEFSFDTILKEYLVTLTSTILLYCNFLNQGQKSKEVRIFLQPQQQQPPWRFSGLDKTLLLEPISSIDRH